MAPGDAVWFTVTPGSPATLPIHADAFPRSANKAVFTPARDSRHAT
jgi:hypothetical protein